MPLYDYVCANCGHEVEVMHSVHGHGPSTCSVCGGPVKKAIVAPAVHFKGSGWARKERTGSAKPSRSTSTEPGGSSGASDSPPAGAAGTPSSADQGPKDPD
jgi:putative FmdB family regulatory protein